MARIISIVNQKGGTGKSACTANLAVGLAQKNGRLGGIPICMQMNNEVVPRDANNYMHLLHKITFFYTGGHLTLEDTFGPVIWHPRMFIPIQTALAGTLNIRFPDNVYQNTGYILSNRNQNKTFEHILTAVWPEAILQDLYHVYAQIEKGIVDMQTNQREILCSKQWNQITKDFGYSQIIPEQYMTISWRINCLCE